MFDAIKVMLGIPKRYRFDSTLDGSRIYMLIERRRRNGPDAAVKKRVRKVGTILSRYYCLSDLIVLVRRELPDVRLAEDKILLLEKERAELDATTPTTPGESKYKRERLAEIGREVSGLL